MARCEAPPDVARDHAAGGRKFRGRDGARRPPCRIGELFTGAAERLAHRRRGVWKNPASRSLRGNRPGISWRGGAAGVRFRARAACGSKPDPAGVERAAIDADRRKRRPGGRDRGGRGALEAAGTLSGIERSAHAGGGTFRAARKTDGRVRSGPIRSRPSAGDRSDARLFDVFGKHGERGGARHRAGRGGERLHRRVHHVDGFEYGFHGPAELWGVDGEYLYRRRVHREVQSFGNAPVSDLSRREPR